MNHEGHNSSLHYHHLRGGGGVSGKEIPTPKEIAGALFRHNKNHHDSGAGKNHCTINPAGLINFINTHSK
jgi:hypothetical protein